MSYLVHLSAWEWLTFKVGLFSYFMFYILFICSVCVHEYHSTLWILEDNVWDLAISLHHIDSGNLTKAVSLGCRAIPPAELPEYQQQQLASQETRNLSTF